MTSRTRSVSPTAFVFFHSTWTADIIFADRWGKTDRPLSSAPGQTCTLHSRLPHDRESMMISSPPREAAFSNGHERHRFLRLLHHPSITRRAFVWTRYVSSRKWVFYSFSPFPRRTVGVVVGRSTRVLLLLLLTNFRKQEKKTRLSQSLAFVF